jgi:hypothetical protein
MQLFSKTTWLSEFHHELGCALKLCGAHVGFNGSQVRRTHIRKRTQWQWWELCRHFAVATPLGMSGIEYLSIIF